MTRFPGVVDLRVSIFIFILFVRLQHTARSDTGMLHVAIISPAHHVPSLTIFHRPYSRESSYYVKVSHISFSYINVSGIVYAAQAVVSIQ
ncbi:hypothetical protein IEO21_08938 [Rhodonia placenta]|uniref:Secreted protein n=1 Tax=Rhodonia placenta TaxID=104341 RepID=A0A8H7NVQ1_9APHY|nr:hypothetical protein IEO21_08938 [Postia placenta]